MAKNNPTRCSECGGSEGPFTLLIDATNGGQGQICVNCKSKRLALQINDLETVEDTIEHYEKQLAELELNLDVEEKIKSNSELASFAFTPMGIYKLQQQTLSALKIRRQELLRAEDSEYRLKYELKKKVENEEYEQAQKIKDQIDQIRSDKQQHTPPEQAKKVKSILETPTVTDGKCIRCKINLPIPPGLFKDYDIGKSRYMCMGCAVFDLPLRVTSVKMADEMLEELERFTKMLDGMALFQQLLSGEISRDSNPEELLNDPNRPKSAEAELLSGGLKLRKTDLQKLGAITEPVEENLTSEQRDAFNDRLLVELMQLDDDDHTMIAVTKFFQTLAKKLRDGDNDIDDDIDDLIKTLDIKE